MKYENLKFDVEDNIGRITLNRPNSANAITIPLVKELLDVVIRCESGAVSYTHLTLPTILRV